LVSDLLVNINTNYLFIMAKQTTNIQRAIKGVSRPGVHAKSKTSNLKSSKLYKKLYKGQGK
jgi:hypothetical protein